MYLIRLKAYRPRKNIDMYDKFSNNFFYHKILLNICLKPSGLTITESPLKTNDPSMFENKIAKSQNQHHIIKIALLYLKLI